MTCMDVDKHSHVTFSHSVNFAYLSDLSWSKTGH